MKKGNAAAFPFFPLYPIQCFDKQTILSYNVSYDISNKKDITWVLPDEKGSYVTVINYSLFNLGITYSAGGINMAQACLITYTRLPKADFEQSLSTPSDGTTMTSLYDDL